MPYVISSGHREPKNCNFSTTSCLLMPIVMIVSQFHVMSKVPKPGCGLESECGTENHLRAHLVHPLAGANPDVRAEENTL